MPRYYLHLHNRTGFTRDDEGLELPDVAAARNEAVRSIRSILSSEVLDGQIDFDGRLDIAGEDEEVVASVSFADAVQLKAEA